MDFIDLAKLPLSTLILVAFFYVAYLYGKWAWQTYDNAQKEAAFVHRFRCHVAFNFGVFLEVYRDNERIISEGVGNDPSDAMKKVEHLLETLAWKAEGKPPDKADPQKTVNTDGFMNYSEVESQFHLLDGKEAGLALYFIEQHALVYKALRMMLEQKSAGVSPQEQMKARKRLRKVLADTIVVSHALLVPRVREELQPGPGSLPPEYHIPDKTPQQVLDDILAAYPSEASGQEPDMYVASYRVLDVKPVGVFWAPLLIAPTAFAMVVTIVLNTETLRSFFFPTGSSVACEMTTWPGGGQSTRCNFKAGTLDAALRKSHEARKAAMDSGAANTE